MNSFASLSNAIVFTYGMNFFANLLFRFLNYRPSSKKEFLWAVLQELFLCLWNDPFCNSISSFWTTIRNRFLCNYNPSFGLLYENICFGHCLSEVIIFTNIITVKPVYVDHTNLTIDWSAYTVNIQQGFTVLCGSAYFYSFIFLINANVGSVRK